MLIRDKVGEEVKKAISEVDDSDVEVISLETNEEFFNAIMLKIKSELALLETTRSLDNLAEVMELIDWIQIALGTTKINELIEQRKEKLGLYYKKFYIKEKKEDD